MCHKPDSLRNIQQYIAIYIPLPSFMLSLFYRIYFRTTESGCQSTHLDQHPLSMWYYYHSFFTSLFYLLFDRSTYVPGGPYLLFLDFHRTSVSDGFFKYRFYFSHNFLVIMIFLRIWLLLFQSRHPTGFIKLPVTIIHLIITTVIFSCQIVHSVLFVGYILPFNY